MNPSLQDNPHRRAAIAAMTAGLALTVLALVVPYLDRAGLADHIRAGYPDYDEGRIDAAVHTYQVYLTVVGGLGIACWLATIWAVSTGKRWARTCAAGIFVIATALGLTDLLITDTSGDTGLPPSLGWIGLLPCLAGLLAVALLLRRSPGRTRAV